MSYARFGKSDVYIYETIDGIECCGCSLDLGTPVGPYIDMLGIEVTRHYERTLLTTARETLTHIADHRVAGDFVSLDADARITSDHPDLDAIIEESDEERIARHLRNAQSRARILKRMNPSE
jgi:hypothetical protein